MILNVNTIVKRTEGNVNIYERILWVDEKNEIAFLIDVYSNKWPYVKAVKNISKH